MIGMMVAPGQRSSRLVYHNTISISTGLRSESAPVLPTTSHQCASRYTHGICTHNWCRALRDINQVTCELGISIKSPNRFQQVTEVKLKCFTHYNEVLTFEWRAVMFEWNVLLNLSGEAATKMFSSLMTELLLQVLGQSTRAMTVWMICDDEGVGDIPGI